MCVSIVCGRNELVAFLAGRTRPAGRRARGAPTTAVHPPHLACCPVTLMSDPGDALAKSKFYRRLFRLPANEVLLNGACIDV